MKLEKARQEYLIAVAQDEARRGIHSLDFNKVTGRHPNSVLAGRPIPVDSRFENIGGKLESVSNFRNTQHAPSIGTFAGRRDLF